MNLWVAEQADANVLISYLLTPAQNIAVMRIAYALIGRAEYLVTGDRDLLVLERVESVDILTPNAFAELLSES